MSAANLLKKGRSGRKKRTENIREPRNTKWLILCGGEKTEPNYLKGLIHHLNNGRDENIDIDDKAIDPKSLVNRVDSYFSYSENMYRKSRVPYEKIILVFDKDAFCTDNFNDAINTAKCRYADSIVAWSNESFELWIYLHFHYNEAPLTRFDYNDKLTDIFRKCGIFNSRQKYNLHGKKDDKLFENILKAGGCWEDAVSRARKLVQDKNLHNPSNLNPATMVFEIVEALEVRYKKKEDVLCV